VNPSSRCVLLAFGVCAALLAGAAPASAAQKTWVGPFGGDWNTEDNWNPAGVPGVDDEANFGNTGARAVVSGTDASVARIVGPQATVAVQGVTLTIAGGGDGGDLAQFQITESGTLAVTGTAKLRTVSLGETSGDPSAGTIEVTGLARQDGSVTEAAAGLGLVRIRPGGLWTNDLGAQASIRSRFENDGTVEASAMELRLSAGSPPSDGSFNLNAIPGGGFSVVELPQDSTFFLSPTSRMTGAGTLQVRHDFFGGSGKVSVSAGAVFDLGALEVLGHFENSADARVGRLSARGIPLATTTPPLISGGGQLTVSGTADIQRTVFSGLGTTFNGPVTFMGGSDAPALVVQDGARVTTNGSAFLGDGGVRLVGGSLVVGGGVLELGAGSRLDAAGGGVQVLEGGTLLAINRVISGTMTIGGDATIVNAGTVDIRPATILGSAAGDVFGEFHQTGGETRVAGTLERRTSIRGGRLIGNGRVRALTADERGTVEPGLPIGTLTVLESFALTSRATLRMEIAGTGQYDKLAVNGSVTAAGTLTITSDPQFTPGLTDTFRIVTAGNQRTGSFENVMGAQTGPRRYVVQYQEQAVDLCVAEGSAQQCGAVGGDDEDGDGVPDAADNCPQDPNTNQQNHDSDGLGDVCDPDDDNDGHADGADNCPINPNPGQQNNDGDGAGDLCDPDDDNDSVADGADNCDFTANPEQDDADGDGTGDACDTTPVPATPTPTPAPTVTPVTPAPPARVEGIIVTPPAEPGGAVIATANYSGPVQRLEWNLDRDAAPDIVVKGGQVTAGDSVRFRPLEGQHTISVRGVGADGNASVASIPIRGQAPRLDDPLERKIDRELDGSAPVYVAGDREDLTPKLARCGASKGPANDPPLKAGALEVRGCFNPVTELSSLPRAERGIVYRVARQHSIPTSLLVKPISDEILSWQPMLFVLELSEIYISYASVRVNGIDIRPAPGAAVIVAPQANTIASSNAKMFLGDIQLAAPAGFTLDTTPRPGGGTIPLGRFARVPGLPSLAGFKLFGDVDVTLTPGSVDNGGAQITVRLELPPIFRIGGGKAVAEAKLRATSDEGLVLDTLSIGPMNLSLGGVGLEDLKIDYTRATEEWKGQAKACVLEDVCLDMTEREKDGAATFPGGIIIRRGRLVRAGATLEFPEPGVPLAPGVNLSHVGFFVGLEPTRFGGEAGIKVLKVVRIDGRLVLAFPSPAAPWVFNEVEAGPAFPRHFYGREHTNFTISVGAKLYLLVPVVGEIELGGAYFLYESPGYVAFGGGIEAELLIIKVSGRVDGEFNAANGKFSVVGRIQACVADVACGGAVAAVSSGGAGACIQLGPLNFGGGVQWARVSEPFLWPIDGCKWSRFIEPNVHGGAAAAQAGKPHVVTIEPGEPDRAVRFQGAQGAPRVRVRGPSGVDFTSPEGPGYTIEHDIRILRSEKFKQTVVGLTRPGRYEIEPLEGSPAIRQITEAEDQPAAKATARVRGTGVRRTLEYDIRTRDGQRVTFFESAGDSTREIATITRGGRGSLKFDSAPGTGLRRIEAQFELNGIPAERLTIAAFAPTSPRLARPRHLSVRRHRRTLVVRWARVPGAARYEVVTTIAGGRKQLVRTRATSRRLRASPVDGGRVTVRAIAPQREGAPVTARFKETKRLHTSAEQLQPPPRERRR
jgi:hypothetical protein